MQEFADYSAIALRPCPYSLRHIWRALVEELRDRHIIEAVKQYTWQTWKVMVRHPNLTNPSSVEEKTLQNQSEMSEVQPSTADATVPWTTDTEAAVVDLNAQANSRSHPTTVITPLDEGDGSVFSVGEEAIAGLPTGESEPISRSSGVDSGLGGDLAPKLLAQVQRAIAPAAATPSVQTLVRRTERTILKDAIAAVMDYRKTHPIANPVGLLMAAIHQQWQPQQHDCTTPPEFNAWFDWARSNRLAIASQQIDGVLHIYATDGQCYPYTEFAASHPMPEA